MLSLPGPGGLPAPSVEQQCPPVAAARNAQPSRRSPRPGGETTGKTSRPARPAHIFKALSTPRKKA